MILNYNSITKIFYDENGNGFEDGMPQIAFKNTETVYIQMFTETPNAGSGAVSPQTDWTKDTSFSSLSGIGAYLTSDNNYTQRIKGTITSSLSAGTISQISATIQNASISTIKNTGNVTLYISDGTSETVEYTGMSISGTNVIFTLASGSSIENNYDSGSIIDTSESVYMQSSLDSQISDIANGLFVFNITADSIKLRQAIIYNNVKEAPEVKGLEFLIFQTVNNTVKTISWANCDTFSIPVPMSDPNENPEIPNTQSNGILAILNAKLSEGFDIQLGNQDKTVWTDYSDDITDFSSFHFFRFRIKNNANATWSDPIPTGPEGPQGIQGDNGATFTPSVDASGNLSWINNGELPNPSTVNIKGAKGDQGNAGIGVFYTGPYTSNTIYEAFDPNTGGFMALVSDQNAIWAYSGTTSGIGNAPPTLPTTSNAYWMLFIPPGEKGDTGDSAPDVMIQYSVDGSNWTATSTGALYIRFSMDGGTTWENSISTKGEKGDKGDAGSGFVFGTNPDYSSSQEYSKDAVNACLNQGGTWIYTNDASGSGNAPPTLPTTSNSYWTLAVAPGADGTNGTNGADGAAATIAVGSVTTGNAGTNVSVSNSGTSSAAVFNFTIPKGDKGDDGNDGEFTNGVAPFAFNATETTSGGDLSNGILAKTFSQLGIVGTNPVPVQIVDNSGVIQNASSGISSTWSATGLSVDLSGVSGGTSGTWKLIFGGGTSAGTSSGYNRIIISANAVLASGDWAIVDTNCTVTLPAVAVGSYARISSVGSADAVIVATSASQTIDGDSSGLTIDKAHGTVEHFGTASGWIVIEAK